MRAILLPLFCCVSVVVAMPSAPQGDLPVRFKSSKRILFLGDSITYGGHYVRDFTAWAIASGTNPTATYLNLGLSSETCSGLSEPGHGGSPGFPRPCIHTRLASVLSKCRPDLVFACYGMNCGIYQPLEESRFQAYRDGMTRLRQAILDAGAIPVIVTPPVFDAHSPGKPHFYSDVLDRYSGWLVQQQQQQGWLVIDLHRHMAAKLRAEQMKNPAFTYQKDHVHPDQNGHWVMAQALIAACGDPQAAEAPSAAEMLARFGQQPDFSNLVFQRQDLLQHAWLTETKHARPGVKPGLPLPAAEEQAATLTRKIGESLQAISK